MLKGTKGFRLESFLLAFEVWRRGLTLTWYYDSGEVTKSERIMFAKETDREEILNHINFSNYSLVVKLMPGSLEKEVTTEIEIFKISMMIIINICNERTI